MNRTKLGLAAAAIAVLASTAVGSAALAAKGGGSDQRGTQTSSSTSGTFGTGSAKGTPDGQHPGMGDHTAVTGDALSKLTAALKAKGYVLQQAMSDADGSYDVAATKNGTNVMLDVSKDLATITERQVPPAGTQQGGPGAPQQAPGSSTGGQPTIQGSAA